MDKITTNDSLEDYQAKMAYKRRIKLQAQAIMGRAVDAGIPKKFRRINQSTFGDLLDTHYHSKPDFISDYIYHKPLDLLKKEFIVIDGGSSVERKMAGFAILFRLIACDKRGLHKGCTELAHQVQTLQSYDGMSRNDITSSMRSPDILFLSEFDPSDFKKGFDTGRFFDEILSYRDDNVKTTVITIRNNLPSSRAFENEKNVATEDTQYGEYICSITQADETKDKRFFRIRVKTNERR